MESWGQVAGLRERVLILLDAHTSTLRAHTTSSCSVRQGGMNNGYPVLSKFPHPLCAKVMNGMLMK